uniref:Uncharacterized protein n=1 Tax=Clytia hemisphaerica TaxID=252671 RepID=A0A7M5VEQ5_9CNID
MSLEVCKIVAILLCVLVKEHDFWRMELRDVHSAHAINLMPFKITYEDNSMWTNHNLSWYSSSNECNFHQISPVTEVTCKKPGKVFIGYRNSTTPDFIEEVKSILLKPTRRCYKWNIDILSNSTSGKIMFKIYITQRSPNYNIKDADQLVFKKLGEEPHIETKYFTLNKQDNVLLQPVYNDSGRAWLVETDENQNSDFYLHVSSKFNLHYNFCLISPTSVHVTSAKYNLTKGDGIRLENMTRRNTDMDQVVLDPSDPKTLIIAR